MKSFLKSYLSLIKEKLLLLPDTALKGVTLGSVLLIIYLGVEYAWVLPSQELERKQLQLQQAQLQTTVKQTKYQAMQNGSLETEKDLQLKHIASLNEQLQLLDKTLDEFTSRFVPPEEMSAALRQLLKHSRGVRILRMENKEPELIEASKSSTVASNVYYRHDVEIELQGSYRALLAYLQSMEKLPWKLIWREYRFESEGYPQLRAVLQVSTLASSKTWITG